MKVLDLFSGIGGFSIGLERAGMETVAFCEIDPFCRKVLAKHWPDIPIHDDIKELTSESVGHVDIITGGYPCQPFSHAGNRRGAGDDRHLWPEYLRLIREIRPRWVIGENVAGHISMGLDRVLSDLEDAGYTWEAFVIPACAVDARHRRDRIWWIASNTELSRRRANAGTDPRAEIESTELFIEDWKALPGDVASGGGSMADSESQRLEKRQGQGRDGERLTRLKCSGGESETSSDSECLPGEQHRNNAGMGWEQKLGEGSSTRVSPTTAQPAVCRGANGIPRRVDRLRSLGNAVVPQIPEIIGRAIMELEK